jgi:hypothetical protein
MKAFNDPQDSSSRGLPKSDVDVRIVPRLKIDEEKNIHDEIKLELRLATAVDDLIKQVGYARTLEILQRECKLVFIGMCAQELEKKVENAVRNADSGV